MMTSREFRPIHSIAAEVSSLWAKPYFGAVPYLQAMRYLGDVTDEYGADRASDILRYFISNAATWRGEDARRIKAEIKAMIKYADEMRK